MPVVILVGETDEFAMLLHHTVKICSKINGSILSCVID